ncbi:MAG: hypothetical protein Q9215_007781, partial [Flavoplaca cf. flavocitrina]
LPQRSRPFHHPCRTRLFIPLKIRRTLKPRLISQRALLKRHFLLLHPIKVIEFLPEPISQTLNITLRMQCLPRLDASLALAILHEE